MAYEKQTWNNLPDKTTPLSAARLNHLETQYDEAERFASSVTGVSVASFGVSPDTPEVDQSDKIQEVFNSLPLGRGGVVIFPPGRYRMDKLIVIPGGVRILGYGAEILKTGSGSPGFDYIAFAALPQGPGRIRNVSVVGLSFKGNLPSNGVMVLWAHRVTGVQVKDVTVSDALTNGHCLDLQGCFDVTVEDCIFSGMSPKPGREFAECIQVDGSTRAGSPRNTHPGQVYDGTPSEGVYVRRCRFLKQGSYLAPRAFGCHGSVENLYYKNLVFEENYLETPPTSTQWVSVINFVSVTRVVVRNNVFNIDPTGFPYAVAFNTTTRWGALSDVDNSGATSVPSTSPMRGVLLSSNGNTLPPGLAPSYQAYTDTSPETGFKNYSSVLAPVVSNSGGSVTLSGVMTLTDPDTDSSSISGNTPVTICWVPEGARPSVAVRTISLGSASETYLLDVQPSGAVRVSKYSNAARKVPYLAFSISWVLS